MKQTRTNVTLKEVLLELLRSGVWYNDIPLPKIQEGTSTSKTSQVDPPIHPPPIPNNSFITHSSNTHSSNTALSSSTNTSDVDPPIHPPPIPNNSSNTPLSSSTKTSEVDSPIHPPPIPNNSSITHSSNPPLSRSTKTSKTNSESQKYQDIVTHVTGRREPMPEVIAAFNNRECFTDTLYAFYTRNITSTLHSTIQLKQRYIVSIQKYLNHKTVNIVIEREWKNQDWCKCQTKKKEIVLWKNIQELSPIVDKVLLFKMKEVSAVTSMQISQTHSDITTHATRRREPIPDSNNNSSDSNSSSDSSNSDSSNSDSSSSDSDDSDSSSSSSEEEEEEGDDEKEKVSASHSNDPVRVASSVEQSHLPSGWQLCRKLRTNKTRYDKYFVSPDGKYRCTQLKQVRIYHKATAKEKMSIRKRVQKYGRKNKKNKTDNSKKNTTTTRRSNSSKNSSTSSSSSSKKTNSYECLKCNFTTGTGAAFASHMRAHTGTFYNCVLCTYTSDLKCKFAHTNRTLKYLRCFPRCRYQCNVCRLIFKTGSGLQRHESSHSGIFQNCKECGYRSDITTRFQYHNCNPTNNIHNDTKQGQRKRKR